MDPVSGTSGVAEHAGSPGTAPTIGVVICAYTMDRWDDLSRAVEALQNQLSSHDEIIVVIDHNDELLARSQAELADTQVVVIPSSGTQGLSGARNTGIDACDRDLVLFLDDDAFPMPGWVSAYRARFAGSPEVIGVGGAVEPNWEGGVAPRWMPQEFYWVIGCDYRGLAANGEEIRNPIGASMGLRRTAFDKVGRFNDVVGRVGALPVGCEETELCIRVRQEMPNAEIVRDTRPIVRHFVPKSRQKVKYFVSRCFHEGRSKAAMTAIVGAQDGLSSERTYVIKTLVGGVVRHVLAVFHGDFSGLVKAVMLPVGLVVTTYGYVTGQLIARRAAKA